MIWIIYIQIFKNNRISLFCAFSISQISTSWDNLIWNWKVMKHFKDPLNVSVLLLLLSFWHIQCVRRKCHFWKRKILFMTLSDHQKDLIITMRGLGAQWKVIAQKLGKSDNAVRKYHSRYMLNRTLPPKPKISKLVTDGRVGLQTKAIVREKPNISVRDIEAELAN